MHREAVAIGRVIAEFHALPPVLEQPKSEGALGGLGEAEFLTRTLVSALDNKYAALRASHDELLDSFQYVMAEWDSDVRSTQCFDSRIITKCRLAIEKAEALKKDQNLGEKEPQTDLNRSQTDGD